MIITCAVLAMHFFRAGDTHKLIMPLKCIPILPTKSFINMARHQAPNLTFNTHGIHFFHPPGVRGGG